MSHRRLGIVRSTLRLSLAAVALLVGAAAADATQAAHGRVVDATGAPVAGAEVMIVGQQGSAVTDADGMFTLRPEPRAPFEVIVVLRGGQMMKPVFVREVDWETGLTLLVEPMLAEEVHVTSGLAPSVDATPAAGLTLLPEEEIEQRVPANLNQVLENVAGVSQVSEGQAAVPAVRGLAQGRTLIIIDGARVTSERRAGPSASFLDAATIEGVDVARGPGSVAYGSDAFGGVISVRTKQPAPDSPLVAQLHATAGAGVPEQRASLVLSRGHGSGALLVQGHYRNAEDYDGPYGTVLNSGWSDSGFVVRGVHDVGGGVLGAGLQSDFGRDIERPRDNSAAVRFYYPYENSNRLTASYELAPASGIDKLAVNAFWGTYSQRTDQDAAATASRPRSIARSDVDATDYGLRAVADRFLSSARLEFGVDINGRYGLEAHEIAIEYDAAGAIASTTDYVSVEGASKNDTGLFVQADGALGSVASLAGGIRLDLVANRNVGGYFGDHSVSNAAGSGFGAVTVGPIAGLSFTAQYSHGYRDPRLSDRYYRGPTGRGFVTGNPDLDPETSDQFDMALRYTSGPARVAAYLYRYDMHDLIERYEVEPDHFYFRNRGEARVRGAELEMQLELGAYSIELAGQIARGEALDGAGGNLDDMPADSMRLVARRTIGTQGQLYGRIAAYADYDRPGPNEEPAPGYTLFDLGATWRLSVHFEVRALGRNLFNSAYHASPVRPWVYAPGRNGSLSVAVTF